MLADDLGFGDIGAFGSEIETPKIDRLAKNGIRFTNFHVGAACSPTRTMLMTGVDNHLAGLGNMLEIQADNQFGKPGYEGHLNDSVVTVATLLQDGGYHTYMVGKWHLGEWAYDRESHIGKLDKGLDEAKKRGWTVVSMKRDWKVVYPFKLEAPELLE